jgi:hypothetical protein
MYQYIIFPLHSPFCTLSLCPPTHTLVGTNTQTGHLLPTWSPFLKKGIFVCLRLQRVSLWYFHVYMYYNPNWFIPSIFLLSTLVESILILYFQVSCAVGTFIFKCEWVAGKIIWHTEISNQHSKFTASWLFYKTELLIMLSRCIYLLNLTGGKPHILGWWRTFYQLYIKWQHSLISPN